MVACCDVAIGTQDAVFSFSEARLGLIPATISPYVIEAIGARAARRYFLTAERFTAGWLVLLAYPRLYAAWLLWAASAREIFSERAVS